MKNLKVIGHIDPQVLDAMKRKESGAKKSPPRKTQTQINMERIAHNLNSRFNHILNR